MLQATELRKGHIIKHKDDLWMVLDTLHVTPGNWRGFVKAKLRNLRTGGGSEERFQSTDKFEQPHVELKQVEFSYSDANGYVFMDPHSYEQITIPKEKLSEEDRRWLQENMGVNLQLVDGEPLAIELPSTVEIKIQDTEPQMRGATAAASYKPAILENGVKITVPPFIQIGELVLVNPREGTYLGRAGGKPS
jgi:elongation factor P